MLRARQNIYFRVGSSFRAGFYCHLTLGLNKMAEAALEAFQLWLRAVHTYPCVSEGSGVPRGIYFCPEPGS